MNNSTKVTNKYVYFIRHGQSYANLGIDPDPNARLTPDGKIQAKKTGEYLLKHHNINKFDCIISSTLDRAVETAEIINQSLLLKHEKTDLLIELKQGAREGKRHEEFIETDIGRNWWSMKKLDQMQIALDNYELSHKEFEEKYGIHDPTKETIEEINTRVEKFIDYINSINKERIIVVTHGAFMIWFLKYFNKNLIRYDQYALDWIPNYLTGMSNCSISIFAHREKNYDLVMWGSDGHLSNFQN